MKRIICFFIAIISLTVLPNLSWAKLRIVATTPDLADIAKQIGGEQVDVESLAKGTEDIHTVPQRPSFVPKLNRADAVVLLGFDAEHAFLPALLDVAQNPALMPGKNGYIDCSVGIKPLDVPAIISRAEGEQHPLGNPHYNIDPRNGAVIAKTISSALARLDPSHGDVFVKNENAFESKLKGRLEEWNNERKTLIGTKAVSYHPSMAYLADYLGIKMVGTLEPKPGIAPTPKHLEELVQRMKLENATLILREVQYSDQTASWLAAQTGAKVATVATMGGAFPDSGSYIGMIAHNIRAIVATQSK